ncbi:MAG: F0F1 ATP synthase subunit A [Clostridiales bacterium]|nr:F0F1 ATP synthase subunit A [Candidatus Coliplasma equi]
MGEASETVIHLFGFLDVTGEVITMWAIIAVIALISFLVTRNLKERPGKFQNVIETGVEYLDNYYTDLLGKKHTRKYFFFLGSLFVFIIFANYSGLLPGMGLTKYFKAPTASLSVTLGLGICAFLFLQWAGLNVGVGHYFKRFIKPMFVLMPLLVLDEFIKPASLALRLYGNVFGEETVTEELYGILPIGVPAIMMALSLLFCAIQAVVFTMLVSIYLEEAIETD